jgi:cytochrome c-type biogenesis protein CcmH
MFMSFESDNGLFSMNNYFWFVAGTMTGLCAAVIALPLVRGAREALERRRVRVVIAASAVVSIVAGALVLYEKLGRPELLDSRVVATGAAHPGVATGGPASPDSMQDAVARLEERLARGGGQSADWLLLAQSYDFMGRTADAERARQKADGGGKLDWPTATTAAMTSAAVEPSAIAAPSASVAVSDAVVAGSAIEYEKRVRAHPDDVDAWRMLATIHRRAHDYAKARDALARVVKLDATDADAWADYADTLGSASGTLRGPAAKAIAAALRLDPAHTKALWLEASLAHEENRYTDALATWKKLRAGMRDDSSDARIVDANMAEAAALAGQPLAAQSTVASAEVSGTVAIDRRLAAKVPAGATLYIYAKAADSPGPPLAVLRQVAGAWPVTFRLDDTLAMLPSRKLSQFERVIVEARISSSGLASPSAGDLFVTSAVLKPAERKKVALVIDREVS